MLDKLLTPTKRELLKGFLFAAPAVVVASNLMPVKAFKMAEAAATAVNDVYRVEDVNLVLGGQWTLYVDPDASSVTEEGSSMEKYVWMKPNMAGQYIRDLVEVKRVDLPDSLRINQTMETVNLMKLSNAPVVWDLPPRFRKARGIIGV